MKETLTNMEIQFVTQNNIQVKPISNILRLPVITRVVVLDTSSLVVPQQDVMVTVVDWIDGFFAVR